MQPADYIGIDADPMALRLARERYPSHMFRLVDAGYSLPAAPSVFFWSSWFDTDESEVIDALKTAAVGRKRVVIGTAELVERRKGVSSQNDCWTTEDWTRMATVAGLVPLDIVPLSAGSQATNPAAADWSYALMVFGPKAWPAFKARWPWSTKRTKDPEMGYYTNGRSLSGITALARADI
jgi:hypothetical protein